VAVFEAIRATRAEGRGTYAVLVCQDVRSALRTLFRYASEPFDEAPILRGGIVSKTADSIELENGVTIAAYPCRPHGIRGIRARVAVCDELAFFRSSENVPQDVEMLRALRPCLATTGGRLIVLSSPYAQSGALWELHRKHYGRDESSTLVWLASAPAMNPTLPADYLERIRKTTPKRSVARCSASSAPASRRSSTLRFSRRASSRTAASFRRPMGSLTSRSQTRAAGVGTPSLWQLLIETASASSSIACVRGNRRSIRRA
jgi:hypothetical protein